MAKVLHRQQFKMRWPWGLTTRSTIALTSATTTAGTVGALAKVSPGVVTFEDGDGLMVGEECDLEVLAEKGAITFSNQNAGKDQ